MYKWEQSTVHVLQPSQFKSWLDSRIYINHYLHISKIYESFASLILARIGKKTSFCRYHQFIFHNDHSFFYQCFDPLKVIKSPPVFAPVWPLVMVGACCPPWHFPHNTDQRVTPQSVKRALIPVLTHARHDNQFACFTHSHSSASNPLIGQANTAVFSDCIFNN